MMVQILKEADFSVHGNSVRLVQLSADYDNNEQEVRARLLPRIVEFHRLFNDAKPKAFWLSSADMDTLTVAWSQYKADLAAAEQAEQARQQEVLAEAYSLARAFKVDFDGLHVEIKEETDDYNNKPFFTVSVPALNYSESNYPADAVLQEVKAAIASVEDNIIWRENKGGQTDKDQRMIAAYRAVYPLKAEADKAGDEQDNDESDVSDDYNDF